MMLGYKSEEAAQRAASGCRGALETNPLAHGVVQLDRHLIGGDGERVDGAMNFHQTDETRSESVRYTQSGKKEASEAALHEQRIVHARGASAY